jgi:hypothetical protein
VTPRRRLPAVATATLLLAACEIPYDFDGEGGADHVYVDNAGVWHDLDLPAPIWTQPVGNEFPAPGDYDGDGQWEAAAVDLTTGLWTTAGTRGAFTVTMPADTDSDFSTSVVPVPADYDGDGDTDPAWFSESSATWQIDGGTPFVFGRPSTDAGVPAVSGMPFHDIAAPADYDGDGDTDAAVYRIETGEVHILGGTTIETGVPYGFPVPANYTPGPGDEASVLGLAGVGWMVEGTTPDPAFATGISGAIPVPADYDGDGTAERAYTLGSAPATWQVEGAAPRTFPADAHQAAPLRPHILVNILFVTFLSQACVEEADPACPS